MLNYLKINQLSIGQYKTYLNQNFSKVIVSTDDKKIAKIVNKMGVETPFLRPDIFLEIIQEQKKLLITQLNILKRNISISEI